MMKTLILLTTLGLLAACKEHPDSASAAASAADGWKQYGAPLGNSPRAKLASVLANPSAHAGKKVRLDGEVRRACAQKGCWMELSDGSGEKAPGCRVTFKDYGFFVPKDSAGAKARMEAVVEVETVKKSHVEHMEAEGATFEKKNPDGTAEEVRLVASGVLLKK